MIAASLLLLVQAAHPDATHIEQLPSARNADPAVRLPPGPDRPAQAATVTQLPSNLQPLPESREEALVEAPATTAPASRASAEIARAVGVIRGRGQQVTPELLAREVGPDVLDVYLSRGEGGLPPTGVPGVAVPKDLPPGTTIIPSGGVR